jgi:hypothetical protein
VSGGVTRRCSPRELRRGDRKLLSGDAWLAAMRSGVV